jgi:pimeloyl-ACP methyl ester carboxylesterase
MVVAMAGPTTAGATTSAIQRGYVSTSHGQVHFRTAGVRRHGDVPLVLLHQTASSSVMFEQVMARLADRFWMVAPDTPGFGGTEPLAERATMAGLARVIAEALGRLEIDHCHLFGHHSGASLAVQMLTDRPKLASRLILSGPPYLTQAQLEKLIPTVTPVVLDEAGGQLTAVWQRIRKKDPGAPLSLAQRETVQNLIAGARYPEVYEAVFRHDFAGQLARLEVPTMVMAGPDDTIFASLEPAYRALGPGGTMKVLPRGGTYVCDREPELVADAIREFLLKEVAR